MSKDFDILESPLLGPADPPAFEFMNKNGAARCILVCDHGGRAVPKKLGTMGLAPEDLETHYAHDIGTRWLTEILSRRLDAPAIIGNYSRLVVDVNRRLDHPTAFVKSGDDKPVPANQDLSAEEKALRVREIYEPYHTALEKLIDGFMKKNTVPAVISLHSFAPIFFNQTRPWDIGLLWVCDPRLPQPMIEFFREQKLCVGDNEPYDARVLRGTTINHHADARRLPNALLEIRNDLLDTEDKANKWADRIHDCLVPLLADESLYTLYDGEMPAHDPEKEQRYFEDLIAQAKKKT